MDDDRPSDTQLLALSVAYNSVMVQLAVDSAVRFRNEFENPDSSFHFLVQSLSTMTGSFSNTAFAVCEQYRDAEETKRLSGLSSHFGDDPNTSTSGEFSGTDNVLWDSASSSASNFAMN